MYVRLLLILTLCTSLFVFAEEPLCTVALISNPYVTSLESDALAKRRGSRTWLKDKAATNLADSVAAVNELKPDACIVFGSLSWTGTAEDLAACRKILDGCTVKPYIVPGSHDVVKDDNLEPIEGGHERVLSAFHGYPQLTGNSIRVKDTLFVVTGAGLTADGAIDVLKSELAAAAPAKAVLHLSAALRFDKVYLELVKEHHIAARLEASNGHNVDIYGDTLPIYKVASSGWVRRAGPITLMRIYSDRIELAIIQDEGRPEQVLTVPNPMQVPRLDVKAETMPSYKADLALKPELTFIQLSDSQLDDGTVPALANRYKYAPAVNRLAVAEVNAHKPAFAFMTGDLVNKNTPTEWREFIDIYKDLAVPLHVLPGNHDMTVDIKDPKLKDWNAAAKAAADFSATIPDLAPKHLKLYRHFTKEQAYYSFQRGSSTFICLDTSQQRVDEEQLVWLRQELEKSADAAHVFLLGHHPILPAFGNNVEPEDGGDAVLALMKEYKVVAYLFGHRHSYGYRVQDGSAHILCDCLCWGEYRSFQIYHVFPDRIVACWKPIFRTLGSRPLYERVTFPEPRYQAPKGR